MTDMPRPSPTLRDVLRNSHFTRLLMGQFISQLGDGLINLSLIIMINRLLGQTGAEAAIGILLICMTAPRVIIGLLAGVYVDRLDRKRLMIVSDLARGAIVLACLLVRRPADVWIYYVSAALMAAIGSVFGPAKDASLPHLVKKDQLLVANSLSQTSFIIALTTGSALAGVLMGAFESPAPAIVFDALSFFVSAAFIITLPIPHHASEQALDQSAQQVWRELKEGLSFVAHQRVLVGTMIGFAITMLGAGATNVLFVPFLVNDLHMSETYLGFVDLTQMAGMVLINVFIARLAARWTPAQIVGVGIIGLGLSIAATGWVRTAWVLFPLSVLWGIFLAPVEASANTIMQSVPDRIRGRTLSAVHTVIGTTNVASMALAGAAGAAIGARSTFIAGGLIAALGGVLAWLLMRERSLTAEFAPERVAIATDDDRT